MINCTCEVESFCYSFYNLIVEINEAHSEFSKEFASEKQDALINLKRKQVNHVTQVNNGNTFSVDNLFLQLISNYREKLLYYTATDVDFESQYTDLILRTRTKESTSIINKLKYYLVGKNEAGKLPLNKCLNDLFGI